jgi:hypothetical protein
MYLNFRISRFPYTLQHAGSGIGKSLRRPTLSGAVSSGPILWFGPGGAILPSRPRRYERQRAQRRSMMARQRHRRLVIDGREQDGILARHGTSRGSTEQPINYVERKPLKLRAPAQHSTSQAAPR